MRRVVVGSEAIACGELTRSALRWNYRRILPDVYLLASVSATLHDRTVAAWLWSRRRGVIAGSAASALHGAKWVKRSEPIEMIWRCGRPPPGIVARHERLAEDEVTTVDGISVTTPERTAFDLARRLPRDEAVARLDALARATGIGVADVLTLKERFRGHRGTGAAVEALNLMDGGARTPGETWLRLWLVKRWPGEVPVTEIMVADGGVEMRIGVGYQEPMVGVDFEGKGFHDIMERNGHRGYEPTPEFAHRMDFFESCGWKYIYLINEDSKGGVWMRVSNAFDERGFTPRRSRPDCLLI